MSVIDQGLITIQVKIIHQLREWLENFLNLDLE